MRYLFRFYILILFQYLLEPLYDKTKVKFKVIKLSQVRDKMGEGEVVFAKSL